MQPLQTALFKNGRDRPDGNAGPFRKPGLGRSCRVPAADLAGKNLGTAVSMTERGGNDLYILEAPGVFSEQVQPGSSLCDAIP